MSRWGRGVRLCRLGACCHWANPNKRAVDDAMDSIEYYESLNNPTANVECNFKTVMA